MSPESLAPESTQTVDAPKRVGIFTPFRSRNFTLLFVGQFVSFLGDQAYGIALPWTVLAVTGDARQMSTVLVAGAVPRVLLILIGGALADRISPRAIMLFADATRVLVVGALGVSVLGGLPPLWVVAVLAAAEGAASGLFSPCFGSITPAILPPEALAGGNGLIIEYWRRIPSAVADGGSRLSFPFLPSCGRIATSYRRAYGNLRLWSGADHQGSNAL